MTEPTAAVLYCDACGLERTITGGKYLDDTPLAESAKKRLAAHSGNCTGDYADTRFELKYHD